MFEGKSINIRMTLRNQLKGVKIQKTETIQSYFSRVSQIKEQLQAIGVMVEEEEVAMTTLNGLPREWDSFIIGTCARRKLTKFNKLWEECVQEEVRIVNREERLNDNEYQPLSTHTKNGRNKRKSQGLSPRRSLDFKKNKKPRRDYSSFECYSCHKMGHISRHCPLKKDQFKKKNRKYHAHAAEEDELDKERATENED